jgi:hypothetical protein
MPDMNIEQAIENLTTNLDKFPQLPFVTDLEVREVFGQEVAQALEFLEGTNKEGRICYACGGKCCQQMGCEFFYQAFGGCPIHEYRPLLCRFHYCEKFGDDQKSLIIDLLDIFVSGVSRLEAESGALPSIEFNMLLYSACRKPEESYPHLIEDIHHIVAAAKKGEVDRQKAIMMLREEILSYRSTNVTADSETPARH